MVARAKHRGPQCRHLVLERDANGLGKAVGRLHDDVDDKLAPRQSGLLSLAFELTDRLLDALGGVLAHAAPPIEHAIDRRLAETGLERNFLDEKRMSHSGSV